MNAISSSPFARPSPDQIQKVSPEGNDEEADASRRTGYPSLGSHCGVLLAKQSDSGDQIEPDLSAHLAKGQSTVVRGSSEDPLVIRGIALQRNTRGVSLALRFLRSGMGREGVQLGRSLPASPPQAKPGQACPHGHAIELARLRRASSQAHSGRVRLLPRKEDSSL